MVRDAAEKGDPQAENMMGYMHSLGLFVKRNDEIALEWYRKSAAQGEPIGENSLGDVYRKGRGVQRNYAEALSWYRKAAEKGYADARNNIGDMYRKGQGVPRNCAVAATWYMKAAGQGCAPRRKAWETSASTGSASAMTPIRREGGTGWRPRRAMPPRRRALSTSRATAMALAAGAEAPGICQDALGARDERRRGVRELAR